MYNVLKVNKVKDCCYDPASAPPKCNLSRNVTFQEMSPFQKGDISRKVTFPEMSPFQKGDISRNLTFPFQKCHLPRNVTFPEMSPFLSHTFPFPHLSLTFPFPHLSFPSPFLSLTFPFPHLTFLSPFPLLSLFLTFPLQKVLFPLQVPKSDSVQGDVSLVSTNSVIQVYCPQMQGWRQFGVTCSVKSDITLVSISPSKFHPSLRWNFESNMLELTRRCSRWRQFDVF